MKNSKEIKTNKAVVLMSYYTPVAAEIEGNYFKTEEKYSVTTTKHVNSWLGNIKAEIKSQDFFDQLLED